MILKIDFKSLCEWMFKKPKEKLSEIYLNEKLSEKYRELWGIDKYMTVINKRFLKPFNAKWKTCHRNQKLFQKRHLKFIESKVVLKVGEKDVAVGRPKKIFSELSDRTKRLRGQEMRAHFSQTEIKNAILHEEKLKDKRKFSDPVKVRNEALALYMDMGLSRSKYLILRQFNKNKKISNEATPSYHEILKAKKDCYPYGICINSESASINIQSLLNHTVLRIISTIDEVSKSNLNNKKIILKCKWGMDGSSGQQQYKLPGPCTGSVFLVMMVPLEMVSEEDKVVWQNNYPSSTRLCRPILFKFMKETADSTIEIHNALSNEINNLNEITVENVNGISCSVEYKLQCSMLDGKVCNALTHQKNTRSCNVCRAKLSQFNNYTELITLKCDTSVYLYGLSPLHSKIRFMECILHISYRLEFKEGNFLFFFFKYTTGTI